jgi:membrane-associated phospholipid phosphatase
MDKLRRKIRRHPYYTVMLYFVCYTAVFTLLEAWVRPVHLIHCRLDDLMPFCRWAVIPYVMWFGWVPAVLFVLLRRSADGFWRVFEGLAAGTSLTLVIYAVFPTGLALRHPVYGSDLFSWMIRMIYRSDTATNVCPSLHVFVTVLLLLALCDAAWLSPTKRRLNELLAVAICASTVLIDQHSLIDVACGVVLGLWVYAAFCRVPVLAAQKRRLYPEQERT